MSENLRTFRRVVPKEQRPAVVPLLRMGLPLVHAVVLATIVPPAVQALDLPQN